MVIGVETQSFSALRGPLLDAQRTFPFSFSAIYRARLCRPHHWRACPAVYSSARAASVWRQMSYCSFKVRNVSHLLSDGGERYGLAGWENGRRRARLLLHVRREAGPKGREEGVLDVGRIGLVPEKLQAFYSRRKMKRYMSVRFVPRIIPKRDYVCFGNVST